MVSLPDTTTLRDWGDIAMERERGSGNPSRRPLLDRAKRGVRDDNVTGTGGTAPPAAQVCPLSFPFYFSLSLSLSPLSLSSFSHGPPAPTLSLRHSEKKRLTSTASRPPRARPRSPHSISLLCALGCLSWIWNPLGLRLEVLVGSHVILMGA